MFWFFKRDVELGGLPGKVAYDVDPPDRLQQEALHGRVVAGDPTATEQVFVQLLDPLIDRLGYKWPLLRGTERLRDQAIDSVFNYLEAPGRFDPRRRSLLGYLVMDAHGDLTNEYRALGRQPRVHAVEDVEQTLGSRNVSLGLAKEDTHPSDSDARDLIEKVRLILPDERDRQVLALMLDGERSTSAFSALLKIEHLSERQQRKMVKREKDRIKALLRRRLGGIKR